MSCLQPGDPFRDARGDEYRVRSILGEGGMAIVYEVDHPRTTIRRAIKVVKFPDGADAETKEELRRCFARERRMLEEVWQLRHPSIAEIYDHGTTADGEPYLVMEALDGETLGAYLRRVGRLKWPEARHIALQIGEALTAIHGLGIVHRDLSTRNVFVLRPRQAGEPLRIKLIDFGLAKYSGLTLHPGVYGSPAYMAPEQAAGRNVIDVRADQFALGAVLFELLSGTPAFAENGHAVHDILEQVQSADLGAQIDQLAIPARAREALRRALNKTPGARFPRTQELLHELQADETTTMASGRPGPTAGGASPGTPADEPPAEATAEHKVVTTSQASGRWAGELPPSPSRNYYIAILVGLALCGTLGYRLGGRLSPVEAPRPLDLATAESHAPAADASAEPRNAEAPRPPDLAIAAPDLRDTTPPPDLATRPHVTAIPPAPAGWKISWSRLAATATAADVARLQQKVRDCLQRAHVLPLPGTKFLLVRAAGAVEYTLINSGSDKQIIDFGSVESCLGAALEKVPLALTPTEIHVRADGAP
jgi:serine/threonine-protein kinase